MKLEGIFSPNDRRLRDEAYGRHLHSRPEETPAQLRCVHYTSAQAALSIINSKRLWMRTTTCMSDFREVQHGYQILLNFFADKNRKDSFIAALDRCHQGAALEALQLFDSWWTDIQVNTF